MLPVVSQSDRVVFIGILKTALYKNVTFLDVSNFFQICLHSLKRFLIENLTESYFLKQICIMAEFARGNFNSYKNVRNLQYQISLILLAVR